jgi:hypothetical protein
MDAGDHGLQPQASLQPWDAGENGLIGASQAPSKAWEAMVAMFGRGILSPALENGMPGVVTTIQKRTVFFSGAFHPLASSPTGC